MGTGGVGTSFRPRIGRRPAAPKKDSIWYRFCRTRSLQARNTLIEEYRGFVRSVTRRITAKLPKHVDLEDLEVAGIFGLIDAIQHFDPSRGVRFETYCEMRVRGAILDELRHQDWMPRQWRSRMARRENAVDNLRAGLGREPTEDEIARKMGIPLQEYRAVYGNLREIPTTSPSRVEDLRGQEQETVVDGIEDPKPDATFDTLCHQELYDLVSSCLSGREREIIYLRYFEELTMREIGRALGLSESRVYKIHTALLARMKKRFSARA